MKQLSTRKVGNSNFQLSVSNSNLIRLDRMESILGFQLVHDSVNSDEVGLFVIFQSHIPYIFDKIYCFWRLITLYLFKIHSQGNYYQYLLFFWQERLKINKIVTKPNPNLPTPIRIRLKQLSNTIPNQLSTFAIQLSTLTNDPTLQL